VSFLFNDTGAPSLKQPELLAFRQEFRLQGVPLVRWVPRETQGGGFGKPEDHPFAWGVWVMADGQWRRVVSARGLPREWTSLEHGYEASNSTLLGSKGMRRVKTQSRQSKTFLKTSRNIQAHAFGAAFDSFLMQCVIFHTARAFCVRRRFTIGDDSK